MTLDQSSDNALLSLATKTSTLFAIVAILTGLAGLVLVIQKPVVNDEDIVRFAYTYECAEECDRLARAKLSELFIKYKESMEWPFQDMAGPYIESDDTGSRVRSLWRYLNERHYSRDRHVLLLLEVPEVSDALRSYIEQEMIRSETVTVPVLQSRIASGDFAIAIVFAFIAVHVYAMSHREYLDAMRCGQQGKLLCVTSLLIASRDDLQVLHKKYQIATVMIQVLFVYGFPVIMASFVWCHYFRVDGQFSSHTRLFGAAALGTVYAIVFMIVWIRRPRACR